MAEQRELVFALDFEGSAVEELDDLDREIRELTGGLDEIDTGLNDVASELQAMSDTGVDALDNVGNAAGGMGDQVSGAADKAGGAAAKMRGEFDATGVLIQESMRRAIISADDFGDAFQKSMGASLKLGQSVPKSLQMGFKTAFAFTKIKAKEFEKDFVSKAKSVGTAFRHPIQTIKGGLGNALLGTKKHIKEVGDEAEKAGKGLQDMADKGEKGAGKVKGAFGGMLKSMLAVEAIKAAGKAVVNFAKNAVGAFMSAEESKARFDSMFKDDSAAAAWADNFAKAAKRTTSEIQGAMVANRGLFQEFGATGKEATKLAEVTTSLSYDMAKFFKADDADMQQKLQAALRGNSKALNEYGVALTDTALKEQARKMGLRGELKDLDDNTMAQVRLNAIMSQTKDAQGAAAKGATSLSGAIKDLKGMAGRFMEDAGGKLAPMVMSLGNKLMELWPKIEPGLMALVDVLANGLGEAIPVLVDLAQELLPDLADVVKVVFSALQPLIPLIGPLIKSVLPPLVEILGILVVSLLPPLVSIIEALMPVITAIIPPFAQIAKSVLPALGSILKVVAPLLEALMPVFDLILLALTPILNLLEKVCGWVSKGADAIGGFLGKITGKSKRAKDETEGLNREVDKLDNKRAEPEITVDTSGADKALDDIEKKAGRSSRATADAADKALGASTKEVEKSNKAIEKSSEKLNKAVGNQLQAISSMSEDAYNAVGTHAEKAWLRAVEAARVGTEKIAGYIGNINGMGTVSVKVSDIPHNASGTRNFEGGLTHVHEEGDEVIGLPGGSTILTKGQSDRLLDDAREGASGSRTIKKEVTININVTVTGDGLNPEAERRLAETLKEQIRKQLDDDREEEEKFEINQYGLAA